MILKDIFRKTGPQPGGSVNLYLIPWADVSSIPQKDPVSKKIEDNIICLPGKRFHKYEFSPGKCKISTSSSGSDGSGFFQTTISVSIPGDDADRLTTFSEMINGHFIALLDQGSKAVKLAGSMAIPLLCVQVDYDAGGEQGDFNGTAFQFKNRGFMIEEYAGIIPFGQTAWRIKEDSVYCLNQ